MESVNWTREAAKESILAGFNFDHPGKGVDGQEEEEREAEIMVLV